MWSFLIVDDNSTDALPIKYCIFQLFSLVGPARDTIQEQLIQISNGADSTNLDTQYSEIEYLYEENVYKKEGAFQLTIINSSHPESDDADHLLNIKKAQQNTEYPFHITFINSEYYHKTNDQQLLPLSIIRFQQVFDLLPDSHFFFYSKKFNEYPTYHLWEQLQRQNNGKIASLINPLAHQTWFSDAFLRIHNETQKILYKRSVALYRSRANSIELFKGYDNAQDQVKAEVEKGTININKTVWNVRDFIVGALPTIREEVRQEEMANIIAKNYLIPDLSLAFSKAFSVWAIKDLTHTPRNTYFTDTPSRVKAQAKSQLSELHAAIHLCRHIFNHTVISEMVDDYESVLNDYLEYSETHPILRIPFLKNLRKDYFQSRGDQFSGISLTGSIIRRNSSKLTKPIIVEEEIEKSESGDFGEHRDIEIIQKIKEEEITIAELGLVQIAQNNGIELKAFPDDFAQEVESIELHFPLVDYFSTQFNSFFKLIQHYSEVQEVECLFERKCLKKNVDEASGYYIDLHRNNILFRSGGVAFTSGNILDRPEVFTMFNNIEYFGNYTCALKIKNHWHFYHCHDGQLIDITRDKFIDTSSNSFEHLFDETSVFNKYFCLSFKTFMPHVNH